VSQKALENDGAGGDAPKKGETIIVAPTTTDSNNAKAGGKCC
jgi:hypothetical protein